MNDMSDVELLQKIEWYKSHLAKINVPRELRLLHGKFFTLCALMLNHLDNSLDREFTLKQMIIFLDTLFPDFEEEHEVRLNTLDNNLLSQNNLKPNKTKRKSNKSSDEDEVQISGLNKISDGYIYKDLKGESFEDIVESLKGFIQK